MTERLNRQQLAILTGDVAGYSRLMAADEEETINLLSACREAIGIAVVGHHGRLVDFTGDNFLAEFGSAADAVRAAIQIQRSTAEVPATSSSVHRMEFRLGTHFGQVRVEGDRLYGDVVNIASRLEGFAHPGGLCLSRETLERIAGQVDLPCEDLGALGLKNIEQPVRAYLVTKETLKAAAAQSNMPFDGFDVARGIPTIAVLPLANLSSDPDQSHFVDAMTMDIITGLSCDRRLSLIAYNSVRQFSERAYDIGEVGERLGVRYVVEGAVRRLGPRTRVSAALIEVETRREIWGTKLDRPSDALFDLFDEIVEAIVTALASHLRLAELTRFQRKRPEQLDAWALATRAFASRGWLSLDESLNLAERALRIDPQYAYGWAVLGFLTAFRFPMGLSTDHAADIAASLSHTDRALTLDGRDPWNLVAKAVALQYGGRPAESMAYLQQSLRLNPSDVQAHCYYGRGLVFSGKPALAIAHFERFRRLNPGDPGAHMAEMYHAVGLSFLGHWERAEAAARQSLAACGGRNPWSWVFLAIALAARDRTDDAKAALAELAKVAPHWNRQFVENFLRECQEDQALLPPIFAALKSVW